MTLVDDAREALEHADDPVDVAAAALQLRDLASAIPPIGGGFAIGRRARPYAIDVVLALSLRGFLNPPRPRHTPTVHPRLFELGGGQ